MQVKTIFKSFIDYISKVNSTLETELVYKSQYELIVAIILSAQCTDKRVNIITPALFENCPNFTVMNTTSKDVIFDLIKSCSYPNNKSKHLKGLASLIIDKFNGEIPSDFDTLIKLPGIGRKTANVFLSVIHNQPTMPVDTHVNRLAKRIGFVSEKANLLKVEQELTKNIPDHLLNKTHHWLILHGRYVCKARKPMCNDCQISSFCKYFNSNM
ncbi:MAG: endonuclease III [Bacteroidetes bacterium GWE2_29_8]|nr:MAG: endonuclease III [Bacteroidetes bacterium GWE2_29_8]OFY21704.1 MAG: endonuclease III [Bacteroidetes bacterium GWF2_29_10]